MKIIKPRIEHEDLLKIAKRAPIIDKKSKEKPDERENKTQTPSQPKQGMIYVPSIKLNFAKQRTHLNLNWYNAHKAVLSEGHRIPTIPEFIEFLKYLRDNPSEENTLIYDDITQVKDPWRANWLDADFKFKHKKLFINYNHILDSKGNLKPKNSEPLEDCLMKNKTSGISLDSWINNSTKQGLPKLNILNGNLYYWCPMKDNNSVAGFSACSDWAYLYCDRWPQGSYSSLGVFVCA